MEVTRKCQAKITCWLLLWS